MSANSRMTVPAFRKRKGTGPPLVVLTAYDAVTAEVAEAYEEEVNNAVDALSSLLEPLIIVFVGVVVGTMVIAMYLPIFKMAAVI